MQLDGMVLKGELIAWCLIEDGNSYLYCMAVPV